MKQQLQVGGALLLGLSLAGSVFAAETVVIVEGPGLHTTNDGGLTVTPESEWNNCGITAAGEITAGPQAPRDIDSGYGTNTTLFKTANRISKMNLCDIHYHWNAEHKSAAFSTFVNTHDDHSGYAVIAPASLDPEVRAAEDISHLLDGDAHEIGVMVGDTIEVHFVHTTCNVKYEELDPDKGLGNCATGVCANPQLRVVAQVFKVVEHDADVHDLDHPMYHRDSRVIYTGSTTGSKFNNDHCSPYQVTWDVKKTPATIDAHGLAHWSHEHKQHAHAVRELVTHDDLLSPIKDDDDDHYGYSH